MKKEQAKKKAEERLIKVGHYRYCKIVEMYNMFRVVAKHGDDSCVVVEFPFDTLEKGDLCHVWDTKAGKALEIYAIFHKYDEEGEPLFSNMATIDAMCANWQNYRKTGFNVITGKMDEKFDEQDWRGLSQNDLNRGTK